MVRVGVDDPYMAGRALVSVRRPERSVGHPAQDGDAPLVTSERASVAARPPGPNVQEHQAHRAKDDQEGHDESTRPHRCHCETRSPHAPCPGPPFAEPFRALLILDHLRDVVGAEPPRFEAARRHPFAIGGDLKPFSRSTRHSCLPEMPTSSPDVVLQRLSLKTVHSLSGAPWPDLYKAEFRVLTIQGASVGPPTR